MSPQYPTERAVEDVVRDQIETALRADLANMQTIIDAASPMSAAALTAAVKAEARTLRRLIRIVAQRLDGVD